MSHDEKMQHIDRELRKLQARSLKSGYSAAQVEQFASTFFQAATKAKREKWLKRMVGVGVAALVLCVVLQFKSPYGLATFIVRSAQIKTLAVWDWTEVYHSNCLLANPLHTAPADLTLQHCQICEGVSSVEHVQNVSGQDVMERFFQRDLPVIVDDGLKGWHDLSLRSPRDVAELFERSETLKTSAGCSFISNMASQYGGHRTFLRYLLTHDFSRYFAHWENCEGRAAKMLRTVFPRLDFLPPAVQMAPSSWIFLSRDYRASIFKQVDVGHPLVMVGVVNGQMDIRLEAWSPCQGLCPLLHLTLQPGQVLIITEFLWKLSYLPSSEGESLAVALGGSF
ncbi:hypothetical protein ACOMHN_029669 [Nucella lapillus]